MDNYIPVKDCKYRYVYRVNAKEISVGVYDPRCARFRGINKKFGHLDIEIHCDSYSYGTVKPIEVICKLPDDIELKLFLDSVDSKNGRAVWQDRNINKDGIGNGPKYRNLDPEDEDVTYTMIGWRYQDTDEILEDASTVIQVRNEKLLNFLKSLEQENV